MWSMRKQPPAPPVAAPPPESPVDYVDPFAPVAPLEVPSYADYPTPATEPVAPVASGALFACIRLNCSQQGMPTDARRCPVCDHRTQLAADNRWPRGLQY